MTAITLVTDPTTDEIVKESVVRLLKDALAMAEAGRVDSLIVILGHPDETWTDMAAETGKFSQAVGRLEILKVKWINRYLEDES